MTPSLPSRLFFVYGTLRKGEVRDINRMLPAPRWVGCARAGGELHDLGAYPGMVASGPGWVVGEVYEVSAELERQLDEIEEVWPQQTGEYVKREIAVRLDAPAGPDGSPQPALPAQAFQEMVCMLYEIAPDRIVNTPVIACGDWVRRAA